MGGHESHTNEVDKAREEYLAKHPFDPHGNAFMGFDSDGLPAGFITFPNTDDLQVLAAKFGIEFIAVAHNDDEAVEWLANIIKVTENAEVAGIMLAYVLRCIAPIIGQVVKECPGLEAKMRKNSVDCWKKECQL